MVRPVARREAVACLREQFQMSERRACGVLALDRKMIRYTSRKPPETELRERLRDLANESRRFGYRRLFILLRREGEPSGINGTVRNLVRGAIVMERRTTYGNRQGTAGPATGWT